MNKLSCNTKKPNTPPLHQQMNPLRCNTKKPNTPPLHQQMNPLCCNSNTKTPKTSPRALCEFYFDTSSPWTYLAFSRIQQIAKRTGCELMLKPFLVGAVFNTNNQALYTVRDKMFAPPSAATPTNPAMQLPKNIWMEQDLRHWSDFLGLNIKSMKERYQSKRRNGKPGHPISSVHMLRGALVAQVEEGDDAMVRYATASFEAYWVELLDVSEKEVLHGIWNKAKLKTPWPVFWTRMKDADIKQALRTNTQEVIDRGGFGSPSVYISRPNKEKGFQEFFTWGNDRMELIEAHMLKAKGLPWRFQSRL
jgi:2-hydroxychromene-2-carboxylate isomerase